MQCFIVKKWSHWNLSNWMASHKGSITTAFYYRISYLKYLYCCKYCKTWLAENTIEVITISNLYITPKILVPNNVEEVRGATIWPDNHKQTILSINNPMWKITFISLFHNNMIESKKNIQGLPLWVVELHVSRIWDNVRNISSVNFLQSLLFSKIKVLIIKKKKPKE